MTLFEGKPYCARCLCALRPLGLTTITCDHTSLTVGKDSLDSHAYDYWMVVASDLLEIISRRTN